MICPPCRAARHQDCPELARQGDPELPPHVKAGSSVCDCQHRLPQPTWEGAG